MIRTDNSKQEPLNTNRMYTTPGLGPKKSLDFASIILGGSLVDQSSGGLGNFSVLRTSPRKFLGVAGRESPFGRSKSGLELVADQSGDGSSRNGLDGLQEIFYSKRKDTRDFVKYKKRSKNYGFPVMGFGIENEDKSRGNNRDVGNYKCDNLGAPRNEHVTSVNCMNSKGNKKEFGGGLVNSPWKKIFDHRK